ncbi:PREDICTED: uncharacterized protein LOC105316632 [Amphimedon queenslandica]|uniref:BLOC-1-related complex subunit 7 n=2 Tax=Amphimedon queenslandica TaxID=400682 RepID=A0AAN0IU39_AMPQE|nr:PREDICTED: uncharacterized protein LOC105316632 [Amphimedon queenslandica]|eukprot:XP_011409986.1 PREDICTED: uncharacterized protein LOC105316632 [Amphimedon queenslandica]
MAAVKKRDPSQVAKGRICTLVQQDIDELGKIVKYIRQNSSTREILLKAAKKTSSQEHSMDNTLSNLRTIEKSLEKSLLQADYVGRSMEVATQTMNQIYDII